MIPTPAAPKPWTKEEVIRFLPRPIPAVRSAPLYTAGLALVAVVLLLLQAVYLCMIALAAWATWRYVLLVPGFMATIHLNAVTLVLLVTPIAAGLILTFFLCKPLLARQSAAPALFTVDPAAQPVLFAFIQRLCETIGAPAPAAIQLDLQVNASAALRHGWRGFFTRELTLTIGLPLIAGLTIRQFSGVLAHEFGHFSQHAGMRLYFLIERIRHWFARVAYERDSWDALLTEWRAEGGWRTQVILWVASASIFLSRAVLRGLFHVGTMVSAWFSRQMEFDADRHAASLVGSEPFGEALLRLSPLDACSQTIWESQARTWRERRLCPDFTALLHYHFETRGSELLEQSRQYLAYEQTDRWATHPARSARIAAISGIEGVAVPPAGSEPTGEALFHNFEALVQEVSIYHFRQSLGDEIDAAALVPAKDYLQETSTATRRANALADHFLNVKKPSRWFRLPEQPPGEEPLSVFVSLEDPSAGYWSLLNESLHRAAGFALIDAGAKLVPESFHLSASTLDSAHAEAAASREALSREIASLRERHLANGYLISNQEALWVNAYRGISAEQEAVLDLRHDIAAHGVLLENWGYVKGASAEVVDRQLRQRIRTQVAAILARLERVPDPPFDPARPAANLAAVLTRDIAAESGTREYAVEMVDRIDEVGDGILGELFAGPPPTDEPTA